MENAMGSAPDLATLPPSARQLVQFWLEDFDQGWDENRLAARVCRLPGAGDPVRLTALIELVTYRRSGHAHHDDTRFHGAGAIKGYEIPQERALWEAADPIALYEKRLQDEKILDAAGVASVRREAARRIGAVAGPADASKSLV